MSGLSARAYRLLSIDPSDWRGSLLDIALRIMATLGAIVYVPSVYLSATNGLIGVVVIDTVALLAVFALLFSRGVSFRVRAGVLCAVCYLLGAGLLHWVGSVCQIYLFAFAVLTSMLLGRRAGVFACLLGAVTLLLVGTLGLAAPEMANGGSTLVWLVISLNFAFVALLLSIGTGAVLQALDSGLVRETRNRDSLAQERNVLRTLIDSMPDMVYTKDRDARYVKGNPAIVALVGLESERQLLGKTVFDVFPEELCEPYHTDDFAVMTSGLTTSREERCIDASGADVWLMTIKAPLRGPSGEIDGLVGISRDITRAKSVEDQLRQAQKMEVFGQLAGGVAHDFNNLLTIISACCEELSSAPDLDAIARESVADIRAAGDRATSLTRQLLAFGRQAVRHPQVLNPNTVVTETEKMLRRLISTDVEFVTALDPLVEKVSMDPGQLSQILVNLAVNARDAMCDGCALTFTTRNVTLGDDFVPTHLSCTPGPHVMLSISDTGAGMTKETMARMFEPFFTTKGVGQGTGLGLAMVFGIVQQSAGCLHVASTAGEGTTFAVYLPAVSGPTAMSTLAGDVAYGSSGLTRITQLSS